LIRYVLKRILWVIPVMLGVVIIVFTITYMTPGDPVMTILGSGYTPERYAAKAAELDLDKGYFGQLFTYIWNIVTRFDFGKSYNSNIPVVKEFATRYPISLAIGLIGCVLMVIIGMPLGITSAVKQYSILDYSLTTLALILAAIPGFVLSILSLVYFSVKMNWFPVSGLDSFKSWVLPVLTNTLPGVAGIMRMTRTTMLEVIRQDYIRTARAKGLKEGVILRKHALKNCLIPLVTIFGGMIAHTTAGSIIVENIFNIRGMGTYLYSGILARDYPIINGCVLLMAFIVCIMNLLVDIAYAFIDPRIRSHYEKKRKSRKKVASAKAEVT
jgi:peptide/nickel transport system permease protein